MTTALNRSIAMLLIATFLSACGGDQKPGKQSGGTGGPQTATLGGGPAGGVLIVMADREPDMLNPLIFNSSPAYWAVHLMFRALARRDSTLKNYAPDLAKSWHLENDSTLILEIRNDLRWRDGQPVTVDDVVFTIERQRDLATASPRQGDVAAVTSVRARDSSTVEVHLKRPGLYTVNSLLEVVPVPKHLLANVTSAEMRNAPFNRNPVGNGFYKFGSWKAGQSLTMEADVSKPDGRAAIDRIMMRFTPDINAAMTELLTGEGDLVTKLPATQRKRLESTPNAKVYNAPRVRPTWIAWNTRRPPLDDVRVRRALLMGVDRAAIARGLLGDIGEPALTPIPPVLREHSPDVKPIPFDPAGARKLLEDAGWHDTNGDGVLDRGGKPLHFDVEYISSDQTRKDVLVAMQSMLRRIGVDITPRGYESTTWVQHLREGSFDGSFWGWGWGPGVAGPNAEMVFHSRSIPPKGPNFAAERNPRVDKLIDSVLVVTDTAKARPLWRELEQLMIDDAVYQPIYMDPELFGLHSRFRNVKFRGIEWVEDEPYWYIDPSQKLPRDRAR